VPVTRAASRMAPTTGPPTSLAPATAMLFARFAPSAFMVNGALTSVFREVTHGAGNRDPASARRTLLRGLRARRGVPAQAHPHGHADGQHAVLEHDAEPAAAPHRPALLRAGDRVGQAADELAVHTGADDRHFGQRSDRRDH